MPGGPLPAGYVPGRTYEILVRLTETDRGAAPPVVNVCGEEVRERAYGFQATAVVCGAAADRAGCLAPSPFEPRTQVVCGPGPCPVPCDPATSAPVQYVEHACGVLPIPRMPLGKGWLFEWTAPPPGRGSVELEVAVVSADGDGTTAGDKTWTGAWMLDELGAEPVCDLRGDSSFNDLSSCPEPLPLGVQVPGFTATGPMVIDGDDPVATIYQVECPCDGLLLLTLEGASVHADW